MVDAVEIYFLESGEVLSRIRNMFESKHINGMDFAVAYLSDGGYSCIELWLKKFLSRGGTVRFIVGLSNVYATESSALRRILDLTTQGEINVKYSKPEGREFHPKIVLAEIT